MLHLEEKSSERKYVKSVFHGAYRREVFEKSVALMKILEEQKIMSYITELEKPDIRYAMIRKLFLISCTWNIETN